jgi:ubiquinol-cytochrome c reductase cytochrome b subunit
MGGLIQINPVWLWGPYHPYLGTNGAQPDWYLGWLIGALRLIPNLEISVFGHTLVPNPFFGGVLFPTVVFALLYSLPWLDRRFISRDPARHDLLQSPRENPRRTALAAAVFSAVAIVFAAGSADRMFFQFGFGYEGAIWFFRGAFLAVPVAIFVITRRICLELAAEREHPLRGWSGRIVARDATGGFAPVDTGSTISEASDPGGST